MVAHWLTLCLCGLPLFAFQARAGNIGAADSFTRIRILPVPTLGYAPETRFYAGAVVMLPFQISQRHRLSAAKLEATFTQNRQRVFSASWDYYLGNNRGFSSGNILTARYPDYYWKPGAFTPGALFARYQAKKTDFHAEYLKSVLHKNLFLGPSLRYASLQQLRYMEGDSAVWQSLRPNRLLGLSAIGSYDSRDNLLNPQHGGLFRWQFGLNRSAERISYITQMFDGRLFFTEDRHTLALRFYMQTGHARGPFFDLPAYGGDAARGYFTGRYRGERIAGLQTEWRHAFGRRLGFTLFAGIGNAWMRASGEAFRLKPNGGIGFRYQADRKSKVNLRFDYAWGISGQRGFYVAFGEAF